MSPYVAPHLRPTQISAENGAAASVVRKTLTGHATADPACSCAAEARQSQAAALPAGEWLFSALCIELTYKEYKKDFGHDLGKDPWTPRKDRGYWSAPLQTRFEAEPLLPRFPGEEFQLTGDRQLRSMLICSHDTACDNNIQKQCYVQMLLKVCQKLRDGSLTCSGTPATQTLAGTLRSLGQQQQQQPISFRSSQVGFLRSPKMHFKADVPVEPYLAVLYKKYGIAPTVPYGKIPLNPFEVKVMLGRAEEDTAPFWPILCEPAFRTNTRDGPLGGLHLSIPVLCKARFERLGAEFQPAGCSGVWWANEKLPLLVLLPGDVLPCRKGKPGSSSGTGMRPTGSLSGDASISTLEVLPHTHSSSPAGLAAAARSEFSQGEVTVAADASLPVTVPVQNSLGDTSGETTAAAAAAAAAGPAVAAAAAGPVAAAGPASAISRLLTGGQVYDELARFRKLFPNAANRSVCMVPCFLKS